MSYVRRHKRLIMETFKIVDIVMKGNEHGELRPNTIYAKLVDSKGNLHISATLEYILTVIRDRNLKVKNVVVEYKEILGVKCSKVNLLLQGDSYAKII